MNRWPVLVVDIYSEVGPRSGTFGVYLAYEVRSASDFLWEYPVGMGNANSFSRILWPGTSNVYTTAFTVCTVGFNVGQSSRRHAMRAFRCTRIAVAQC